MRINQMLAAGAPTVSFEFFPPKDDEGFVRLFDTIEALRPLQPSYVSVTYGAGGSTRRKTVELVRRIKHEIGIESMAHLTCVGAARAEIAEVLDTLEAGGVENVLPLRGDPPRGRVGSSPRQVVSATPANWSRSSARDTPSAWGALVIQRRTRRHRTRKPTSPTSSERSTREPSS